MGFRPSASDRSGVGHRRGRSLDGLALACSCRRRPLARGPRPLPPHVWCYVRREGLLQTLAEGGCSNARSSEITDERGTEQAAVPRVQPGSSFVLKTVEAA